MVYHIHGGGFISMSTHVHQTYIRTWANSLEVPIISVEYGKAPKHPFPEGLYDCFEGYMWSLYCFRKIGSNFGYDLRPHAMSFVTALVMTFLAVLTDRQQRVTW